MSVTVSEHSTHVCFVWSQVASRPPPPPQAVQHPKTRRWQPQSARGPMPCTAPRCLHRARRCRPRPSVKAPQPRLLLRSRPPPPLRRPRRRSSHPRRPVLQVGMICQVLSPLPKVAPRCKVASQLPKVARPRLCRGREEKRAAKRVRVLPLSPPLLPRPLF